MFLWSFIANFKPKCSSLAVYPHFVMKDTFTRNAHSRFLWRQPLRMSWTGIKFKGILLASNVEESEKVVPISSKIWCNVLTKINRQVLCVQNDGMWHGRVHGRTAAFIIPSITFTFAYHLSSRFDRTACTCKAVEQETRKMYPTWPPSVQYS